MDPGNFINDSPPYKNPEKDSFDLLQKKMFKWLVEKKDRSDGRKKTSLIDISSLSKNSLPTFDYTISSYAILILNFILMATALFVILFMVFRRFRYWRLRAVEKAKRTSLVKHVNFRDGNCMPQRSVSFSFFKNPFSYKKRPKPLVPIIKKRSKSESITNYASFPKALQRNPSTVLSMNSQNNFKNQSIMICKEQELVNDDLLKMFFHKEAKQNCNDCLLVGSNLNSSKRHRSRNVSSIVLRTSERPVEQVRRIKTSSLKKSQSKSLPSRTSRSETTRLLPSKDVDVRPCKLPRRLSREENLAVAIGDNDATYQLRNTFSKDCLKIKRNKGILSLESKNQETSRSVNPKKRKQEKCSGSQKQVNEIIFKDEEGEKSLRNEIKKATNMYRISEEKDSILEKNKSDDKTLLLKENLLENLNYSCFINSQIKPQDMTTPRTASSSNARSKFNLESFPNTTQSIKSESQSNLGDEVASIRKNEIITETFLKSSHTRCKSPESSGINYSENIPNSHDVQSTGDSGHVLSNECNKIFTSSIVYSGLNSKLAPDSGNEVIAPKLLRAKKIREVEIDCQEGYSFDSTLSDRSCRQRKPNSIEALVKSLSPNYSPQKNIIEVTDKNDGFLSVKDILKTSSLIFEDNLGNFTENNYEKLYLNQQSSDTFRSLLKSEDNFNFLHRDNTLSASNKNLNVLEEKRVEKSDEKLIELNPNSKTTELQLKDSENYDITENYFSEPVTRSALKFKRKMKHQRLKNLQNSALGSSTCPKRESFLDMWRANLYKNPSYRASATPKVTIPKGNFGFSAANNIYIVSEKFINPQALKLLKGVKKEQKKSHSLDPLNYHGDENMKEVKADKCLESVEARKVVNNDKAGNLLFMVCPYRQAGSTTSDTSGQKDPSPPEWNSEVKAFDVAVDPQSVYDPPTVAKKNHDLMGDPFDFFDVPKFFESPSREQAVKEKPSQEVAINLLALDTPWEPHCSYIKTSPNNSPETSSPSENHKI